MIRINSGAPEPTDKFNDTPRDRWDLLLIARRLFLATNLIYDCRCLIEFCEEAELVYAELGFKSAIEMIREGYELEPSQVELAVAWLKANGTEKPVGLGEIVALNDKPGKPKGSKLEPLPKGDEGTGGYPRLPPCLKPQEGGNSKAY